MLKKVMSVFMILCLIGLSGCNEKDDTNPNSAGGGGRPSSLIVGRAVDAQISEGDISVFSFRRGVKGEFLGSAKTDENGFYQVDLSTPDQYILIEVRGGFYIEETSGTKVSLKEGQLLRALTFYKSGARLNLMVTPFTNLAVGLAEYKMANGTAIENAVTEASTAISSMVGVDILQVIPANVTDRANIDARFTPELKYGFMGAAISSWTKKASETNGVEAHTIWTSIAFAQVMYQDIRADGVLDGKGLDRVSNKVSALAFGMVPIDTQTYRSELAQHLMGVVASEANQVAITLAQALPEADRLSNATGLFAGVSPIPFDEEGPVIQGVEAEGLYHNLSFDFKVLVSDVVGVGSVFFDLDGQDLGQAADLENPSFSINTQLYEDGGHIIGVRATDNLGNEGYATFQVEFLNKGSSLNLLSSTWVNHSPVNLFGNYIDNGVGVNAIVVDGVSATLDTENRTWTVEIPLEDPSSPFGFTKQVSFEITDGLGVQNIESITMTMDRIAPEFKPETFYSKAELYNGRSTETLSLSLANGPGLPLRIQSDRVSLNGAAISLKALDEKKIPWIYVHVKDSAIKGIFTPEDEITAELQYSLNTKVKTPWRALVPVIDFGNDYYFLVPLVSEILHEEWDQAPFDAVHLIEIKIRDKAGNTKDFSFKFKVQFVPPEPVIASKAVLSFDQPFENRWALFGQDVQVSEHTVVNVSDQALLFSVEAASGAPHEISRVVEKGRRVHFVQAASGRDWRAQKRYRLRSLFGSSSFFPERYLVRENSNALWEPIDLILVETSLGSHFSLKNDKQVLRLSPESPFVSTTVDVLPSVTFGPWANFYPSNTGEPGLPSTCCDVNYFIAPFEAWNGPVWDLPFASNRGVPRGKIIFPSPAGHFLQYREKFGFLSVEGPRNIFETFSERASFRTSHFEVVNESGAEVLPTEQYYRLPPKSQFTVKGFAKMPGLQLHNDLVLSDRPTFASYGEKKLDKQLSWSIFDAVTLRAIHAVPSDQISNMLPIEVRAGGAKYSYTITR